MGETVSATVEDGIGRVIFERPPINAVNLEANRQLAAAFEAMNADDDVRVVIFQTVGRGFVSGSDVGDFDAFDDDSLGEYEEANIRTINAIYHCRVPVIGALHGYVLGLGTCLAASCDMLVAAEDTFFGNPEVRLGSVGGTGALSMLVPEKLARYMALTGKYVGVQEVAKYGQIFKVVSLDKLGEEVDGLAALVTRNWTKAVQAVKAAIRDLKHRDLGEEFRFDCRYTHELLSQPERDEVLKAFYAAHSGK